MTPGDITVKTAASSTLAVTAEMEIAKGHTVVVHWDWTKPIRVEITRPHSDPNPYRPAQTVVELRATAACLEQIAGTLETVRAT